eukprot:GHRQ01022664.1.p2 GENE.GHRQ01022664.1~~GHRQ01022664.1.p2  ORF type:complete len:191 (+),score=53.36 GHRQ01022664.1:424-996(+)
MDQHDVAVPTLLPPQIPRLFSSSNGTYSFPPSSPGQGPPRLGWLPCQQQQQQQADQLQQVRQQIRSKTSTSSSRRSIPTASRDVNSSSSSGLGGRSPVDVACRVASGAGVGVGIGAGVGGLFCGPSNALQLRLWPFTSRGMPVARDKQQKTVLIMMSNTGGGHKASAEALKQAFEEKYGDKYRVRGVCGG